MQRPKHLPANRWQIAPIIPSELCQKHSHLHPILSQVLYNRGLVEASEIQAFLEGHYLLSDDPFLLLDMDKAVARIGQAIKNEEMIAVYGDFDADGVTSTVLLVEALRGLGLKREQAQPYIPSRVDEGYGLNEEALSNLKARGIGLVITVDCGIRSIHEVAYANSIGLDVIITDHHSLGPRLPEAAAMINPKRPGCAYPEKMLAGVGIAYKLAQALYDAFPERRQGLVLGQLLDLVAIGTVADLAPLLGENRQLVTAGLKVLNQAQRPGIAALAKVARLQPGQMTAESIGFGLGPRINAAGRLSHAYSAARLLALQNHVEANQLAVSLNQLNQQRRRLTSELSARAEAMIERSAPILIAADPDFQSGVVGLVASRLADQHYRPAIVIERGETESRGSCRSIPEFHITEALDQVADLLVRHGGHAQAAGFTVLNEDLAAFQTRMTAIAADMLSGHDLQRTLTVDAELTLPQVDWAFHDLLTQLEPTGYANTTPVFVSQGVRVYSHRTVGQDRAHLQLRLGDQRCEFPAIAFGQGAWASSMPEFIDVVYGLNVNEWKGNRNLQLMVQDIRPAQGEIRAGFAPNSL